MSGYFFQNPFTIIYVMSLYSMESAPRDGKEILAYHKDGKTFHPIKWTIKNNTQYWGMRWNEEYKQHDNDFHGWVAYPIYGGIED